VILKINPVGTVALCLIFVDSVTSGLYVVDSVTSGVVGSTIYVKVK
jgi:hypothetical protein